MTGGSDTGADVACSDSDPPATSSTPATGMEGRDHLPVDPAGSSSRSPCTHDMAVHGAATATEMEGRERVASSSTSARTHDIAFHRRGPAAAAVMQGFDRLAAAAAAKMEVREQQLVDVPYSGPAASSAIIDATPSSKPGVNTGPPLAATGLNPSAPCFVPRSITSASSMGSAVYPEPTISRGKLNGDAPSFAPSVLHLRGDQNKVGTDVRRPLLTRAVANPYAEHLLQWMAIGSPGTDCEKTMGVVPGSVVLDGEALPTNLPSPPVPSTNLPSPPVLPTNLPPLQQDEFLGFINNGGGGFRLEISEGTGEPKTLKDRTAIKEIWADNVVEAFEEIEMVIRSGASTLFVGLDTEFCRMDGVIDPRGAPTSEDMHYDQVSRIVNGGSLLQVGIVLANEVFQTLPPKIFQFNIFFDQSSRNSDNKSLRFLRDVAKLQLDEHKIRGIPLHHFFSLMNSSGLVGNQRIVWITYQGYCDFGYVVRGIEGVTVLPKSRTEFIDSVQCHFPRSYDLKIVHELGICCKKPPPMPRPKGTGGFQAMANGLGVDRIGEAHGAGSDAYLAVTCYKTMVLSSPSAAALLSRFRNRMYGVAQASTLPWDDRDTTEIAVLESSFDREARMFSKMFCNCSQLLVSVEVRFANGGDFNGNHISYAMLRTEAAFSGPVEISFAVSDMSGSLAFGRLWNFRVGSGQDRIEPARLAKMLTEDEVVLNPNILWCSSRSASFAYLVKALSSSNCLPPKLQALFTLMASYFPNHRVVSLMSPENRPARRALLTLRHLQALLRQEPRQGLVAFSDLTE